MFVISVKFKFEKLLMCLSVCNNDLVSGTGVLLFAFNVSDFVLLCLLLFINARSGMGLVTFCSKIVFVTLEILNTKLVI